MYDLVTRELCLLGICSKVSLFGTFGVRDVDWSFVLKVWLSNKFVIELGATFFMLARLTRITSSGSPSP